MLQSPGLSYFVAETGQDVMMPNTELSYSLSAVVYSDRLSVFHGGGGDDDRLWYNTFDGDVWTGDILVYTA